MHQEGHIYVPVVRWCKRRWFYMPCGRSNDHWGSQRKGTSEGCFQKAVERGETAGLLEQLPDASDVFTTTVGNVPPGAMVNIHTTYLGELKHDMEVDGIRFTLPNIICPRYGHCPVAFRENSATTAQTRGISITVDAEMTDGSFIQQIRSPSHPIAINMGTTSIAPNASPKMSQASATLSLGGTQLDTDFVLQIISKDTGVPKAILETHSSIPNHRALMTTLVPKFSLPSEKPEVVFVCDRSSSMAGRRIQVVVQALKIFLKPLPVGVKFNICSFGSTHSFLWPRSVTYNQHNLDQAMNHNKSFDGNYGGTEILRPSKATIEQRYKDIPLELILLTDGEAWRPRVLFQYLNKEAVDTKAPIRVFTLGIGNRVSHSLIEVIARAGNGFSQTVGEGENMDSKVVRMLKGALSPHVNDYTLEVIYSDEMSRTDEDDFETIEKVADSLKVKLSLNEKQEKLTLEKPISLLGQSADLDKKGPSIFDEAGERRYSELPKLAVLKIIQAPQNIPSLFAFNGTSVYFLLGSEAPQKTHKTIILRGTSVHGPLELEIPIQILDTPGETIHQLAAKKVIAELEQGRGWLPAAKDESGKQVKEAFESRFEDMVEREAVRLGVQFQVGGKWCSFVAVEKRPLADQAEKANEGWLNVPDVSTQVLVSDITASYRTGQKRQNPYDPSSYSRQESLIEQNDIFAGNQSRFGMATARGQPQDGNFLQDYQKQIMAFSQQNKKRLMLSKYKQKQDTEPRPGMSTDTRQPLRDTGLVDYQMQTMLLEQQNKMHLQRARQQQQHSTELAPFSTPSRTASVASSLRPAPAPPQGSSGGFVNPPFGNSKNNLNSDLRDGNCLESFDFDTFLHAEDGDSTEFDTHSSGALSGKEVERTTISREADSDPLLHALVALQTFEGFWEWNAILFGILGIPEAGAEEQVLASGGDKKAFGTALAIAFFEEKLGNWRASWELVVKKAGEWLQVRRRTRYHV